MSNNQDQAKEKANTIRPTPPILSFCEDKLNFDCDFFEKATPALFPEKKLRFFNSSLNLDKTPDFTKDHLWHFKPLAQNLPHPLALKYHGHQFQNYNPQIGDGRGFLYAQIFDHQKNQWFDLGTKGSGQTSFSRSGDGRLTLKGAIREALATEILESYAVKTSRTACFFETGENLQRNDEPSPTRSAVLTRYNLSHIRIGTFQRLSYFKKISEIKKLTDYTLKYYFSQNINETLDQNLSQNLSLFEKQYLNSGNQFFIQTSEAIAKLCAQVMMVGFIHGVLNTDNINVTGELFDYGPYRFMPAYKSDFVAAYFDHQGLYAYDQQPSIFLWNLTRLAECLSLAYPENQFEAILKNFENRFHFYLQKSFENRLNIQFENSNLFRKALGLLFQGLNQSKILFEHAFFNLNKARLDLYDFSTLEEKQFDQLKEIQELKVLLKNCDPLKTNRLTHHYFKKEKPETLIIDEIEFIWKAIELDDDWTLFENKIQSIRSFRGCY